MEKTYIGIDPGEKGYVAISANGVLRHIPTAHTMELCAALEEVGRGSFTLMEDVHAIFGASAKSTFRFGVMVGIMLGIIDAYRLPHETVSPRKWQAEMWTNDDMVYDYVTKGGEPKKVVNTKATSTRCAMRLFPDVDFRRTEACKKIDDNKVDATLIMEYARRKNL